MTKSISLWREIEYNLLSQVRLEGKILDLGGSRKSGYHELILGKHEFTVVNISEEYGYDMKFDIQEVFPLESESYDHAIAINVLEHIYKYQNVVNESYRVIKKGGSIVFITPFMFNVHGSPDDYFRYTKSALLNILKEAGFDEKNIQISEIGNGIFSAFYQMISGIIPGSFLKSTIKGLLVGSDNIFIRMSKKYAKLSRAYPLGYYIYATK